AAAPRQSRIEASALLNAGWVPCPKRVGLPFVVGTIAVSILKVDRRVEKCCIVDEIVPRPLDDDSATSTNKPASIQYGPIFLHDVVISLNRQADLKSIRSCDEVINQAVFISANNDTR